MTFTDWTREKSHIKIYMKVFMWNRIDILITLTELGKNIKWHVLIVHETPGDESQLPPVVGLTARHHELPVRNLSAGVGTASEKTGLTVLPAVRGEGFVQRQHLPLIPPLRTSLPGSDVPAGSLPGVAADGSVPAGSLSVAGAGA